MTTTVVRDPGAGMLIEPDEGWGTLKPRAPGEPVCCCCLSSDRWVIDEARSGASPENGATLHVCACGDAEWLEVWRNGKVTGWKLRRVTGPTRVMAPDGSVVVLDGSEAVDRWLRGERAS